MTQMSGNEIQVVREFIRQVVPQFGGAADQRQVLAVAAVKTAAVRGSVTADDVRACVKELEGDKRAIGSSLGHLKKIGVLVATGFKATTEVANHSRPIMVFALSRDWREKWLKTENLPPAKEMLNLEAKTADELALPAEEIFALLAEVNRLATDALVDPLRDKSDALVDIREKTARWGST